MGIFDALTTAVAGLQAQSFALQNISGNIANSQTTGYKETDTSFQDLVSQGLAKSADRGRRHRQLGGNQHGAGHHQLDASLDGSGNNTPVFRPLLRVA